jgi:UDP-N-acetylmuramyl tripeptide synthase
MAEQGQQSTQERKARSKSKWVVLGRLGDRDGEIYELVGDVTASTAKKALEEVVARTSDNPTAYAGFVALRSKDFQEKSPPRVETNTRVVWE